MVYKSQLSQNKYKNKFKMNLTLFGLRNSLGL